MASPEKIGVSPSASNMSVDYVVTFNYANIDKKAATAQFEKLIQALSGVGLTTEVRPGEDETLLVFVRVGSQEHLYGEVYRSRINDWVNGIRTESPDRDFSKCLSAEPLYEAERLRIIYQLITEPETEGGAGITPKAGEWTQVDDVFPLHDRAFNRAWIKEISSSYLLKPAQLDEIRNRFGEQIAYYFAFIQSYFVFLSFIATFGISSWFLLGEFSPIYALVNCLWCVVFTEYWKRQEQDLAIRWGVRGVSRIDDPRRQFKPLKVVVDPVTGEKIRYFPVMTRLYRQMLQIPFALSVVLLQGCLIAACFGIEVFISEIYDGPMKYVLVYLPTGILTTVMPILSGVLHQTAVRLTDFENYETDGAYKTALTQKLFIMDLVTSYMGITLTAFVYIPFAKIMVPYLDVFSATVKPFADHHDQMHVEPDRFSINRNRLKNQLIYFTITAQVVNFLLELVVPYVMRRGASKVKELQTEYSLSHGGAGPSPVDMDDESEAPFLARVRKEVKLAKYDVFVDIREMVIQFGYLALFSVVWPLTSVCFLVNNWIELRADAIKIIVGMQRPLPRRADSIGPWLESLSFLAWVGTLTTAALTYMFSGDADSAPDGTPKGIKGWALLLTVFSAEQSFLVVRWMVRAVISTLESPERTADRRRTYMLRRRFVEESLKGLPSPATRVNTEESAKVDRESLEEQARQASGGVEQPFWARQQGWREVCKAGGSIIERLSDEEESKKEK